MAASPDSVLPTVKAFLEKFYRLSDDPSANNEYVDQFTKDGEIVVASNKAKGYKDLLPFRQAMWAKVSKRKHTLIKIYAHSPTEVMLYGTVDFEFKDEIGGGSASTEWAAKGEVVEEDGKVLFKHYQVFLDTKAVAPPNA